VISHSLWLYFRFPLSLSAFGGISPHFRPRRRLRTGPDHRAEMTVRFTIQEHITGTAGQTTTA
jgi:putative transposase